MVQKLVLSNKVAAVVKILIIAVTIEAKWENTVDLYFFLSKTQPLSYWSNTEGQIWVADGSEPNSLSRMELTGLKHLKTTSFGKVVQANIQGNGSFQMLITCDCYSARQLTLFKGQVPWVCLCVCEGTRAHRVHAITLPTQKSFPF